MKKTAQKRQMSDLFHNRYFKRVLFIQTASALLLIALTAALFFYTTKQENRKTQETAEKYADDQMKTVVDNTISRITNLRADQAESTQNEIQHIATVFSVIGEDQLEDFAKEKKLSELKNNQEISVELDDADGNILYRSGKLSAASPQALYRKTIEKQYCRLYVYTSQDDIDALVKQKITKEIHATIYGRNEYIWVNEVVNFDGGDNYAIRRIHPNLIDTEGTYLSTNMQDAAGNYPYLSELEGIKKNGEIYQSYYFKNLADDKIALKYSYAKLYQPYNWIVATGIPMSDLYSIASAKQIQDEFLSRLMIVAAAAVILLIAGAGVLFVNRSMQEEELEQNAKKNEDLLRNIPGGVGIFHFENNFWVCDMLNDGCLQIPFISADMRKSALHEGFKDHVYAPDRSRLIREYERVSAARDATGNVEYRTRDEEGNLHWISFCFRKAYELENRKYFYATLIDIDQMKKDEYERTEEYHRLREQLTGNLIDVVGSFQINITKNLYISGYSPYEEVLRACETKTADEHFEAVAAVIQNEEGKKQIREIFNCRHLSEIFESGQKYAEMIYQIRRGEGTAIYWIHTTVYMMRNPENGDLEGITYSKNITAQRRNEEILARMTSESYDYIGIIDVKAQTFEMHNGVWSGRMIENGKVISYEQVLHTFLSEYIVQEDREELLEQASVPHICAELARNKTYILTYSIRKEQEQLLRKQVSCVWLNDDRCEVLAVQTDITQAYRQEQEQLRKIQEALEKAEQANHAKTDFVSRISHDIRTPISAITSMTMFAKEDIDDREKLSDDLEKIEASNTFLLSLINDILDISKIDSGKIELYPEPYIYRDFEKKLTDMFSPLCEQKKLRFTIETEGLSGYGVMVDKIRFNQVALNLLSNAVKYTPEGGSITFRISDQPQENASGADRGEHLTCLTYTVQDTGIGMSEEFQKTMFEEFTREHNLYHKNNASSGSGLGLAIVKRIVSLMDGTISVKSAPGEGSAFTVIFVLPEVGRQQMEAEEMHREEETDQTAPLSGKILLAEDNEINTEIAVRILESMGLQVVHAENGEKAASLFEMSYVGEYAAILMDIQMPVMNGYEAAEKIRHMDRDDAGTIPMIAMTADAFTEALEHSRQAGMNDYIVKPIDIVRLRNTLNKWIRKQAI